MQMETKSQGDGALTLIDPRRVDALRGKPAAEAHTKSCVAAYARRFCTLLRAVILLILLHISLEPYKICAICIAEWRDFDHEDTRIALEFSADPLR